MASGLCAALTGRTHGCTDQPATCRFFLPTRSRPHMADFVAEVAEEESGRWRRAINLACPSPVRAVPGDSPNDCQRDFGMT